MPSERYFQCFYGIGYNIDLTLGAILYCLRKLPERKLAPVGRVEYQLVRAYSERDRNTYLFGKLLLRKTSYLSVLSYLLSCFVIIHHFIRHTIRTET
ncbi:MAG TPA: hypothetical protein DEW22_08970 [Clostridiales bacterium]|nr:hypothetical protein [Clostridiales bacterium]